MTTPDIELILDHWLGEGTDVLPDRSVGAVLRTIERTSQRSVLRAPWRIPTMNANLRLALLASTAAIVLLASGSLLWLGALRVQPDNSPSPSISPQPSSSSPVLGDFPNEAERALLAKVHETDCVRGSTASLMGVSSTATPQVASVRCTWGGAAFYAFQLGEGELTPEAVVRQVASENDVPPGDCEADAPAIGTWGLGGSPLGTVACYRIGVDAVIDWTFDEEGLVFRIRVPYADDLSMLNLWMVKREEFAKGSEPPFPSAAELALIRRLPTELGADCERGSYGFIADAMRIKPTISLKCPLPAGHGAKALEVRQISDTEEVSASDVIGALGVPAAGCLPKALADGRWSIGERDTGAIVCYRDGMPTSFIDWSYDDDWILARASLPGADRSPLYEWWANNASTLLSPGSGQSVDRSPTPTRPASDNHGK